MDNGKLVGMVSIQDILTNIYWPQRRQTTGDIVGEKIETLSVPAKGIMNRPPITVETQTSSARSRENLCMTMTFPV